MDKLDNLTKVIDDFCKERDWDQFHTESNLAKSIAIEASELLECFQWNDLEFDKTHVCEELADVITYCIQMAIRLDVDIHEIVLEKMKKNTKKYPVDKCKGNSTKYDKL